MHMHAQYKYQTAPNTRPYTIRMPTTYLGVTPGLSRMGRSSISFAGFKLPLVGLRSRTGTGYPLIRRPMSRVASPLTIVPTASPCPPRRSEPRHLLASQQGSLLKRHSILPSRTAPSQVPRRTTMSLATTASKAIKEGASTAYGFWLTCVFSSSSLFIVLHENYLSGETEALTL